MVCFSYLSWIKKKIEAMQGKEYKWFFLRDPFEIAYWWVYSPSEPGNHPGECAGLDEQAVCPVAGLKCSPFSGQHWPTAQSGQLARPWELVGLGCRELLVLLEQQYTWWGLPNITLVRHLLNQKCHSLYLGPVLHCTAG